MTPVWTDIRQQLRVFLEQEIYPREPLMQSADHDRAEGGAG